MIPKQLLLLQSATGGVMKGTIAITVMGRASGELVSEWKQGIKDIFKPQISRGGGSRDRLSYYLCDSISADQIKALVIKFGGVVVRKAATNNSVEPALLGEYGNCIFEVPDAGEAWRLEAPPNTFKSSCSMLPRGLEYVKPPEDEHVQVVLLPNHNGPEPDVTFATFHFQLPSEVKTIATPISLEEAVEILIREMSPDDRKYVASIPRDNLLGEAYSWGMGIRNGWHLWDPNSPLMRQFPGKQPDDVSSLIIDAVWKRLQSGTQ